MNERTHFFIKIYLSHFIRKCWCWLCVRSELETRTDCYILTQSSSDHSSTSSSFWLGCSLRTQALCLELILTPSSCSQLTPTVTGTRTDWLIWTVCGTWLYNCLMSTCFQWAYAYRIQTRSQVKVIFPYLRSDAPVSLLFTQVHLLIDGSVEGQYVTLIQSNDNNIITSYTLQLFIPVVTSRFSLESLEQ